MTISVENTLVAIFSYNMGLLLKNCVDSVLMNCVGFRLLVIDDDSYDVSTQEVLSNLAHSSVEVYVNRSPKLGTKHGNLYANIMHACRHATSLGMKYLLMIQDDMQVVRSLSENVCREYSNIFAGSEFHLQVDPRFLMRRPYEFVPEYRAFKHSGLMSYADVGFIDLERLHRSGWTLREGERENAYGLRALGYSRYFPCTPIMMHVPFPPRYRNGVRKRSMFTPAQGGYRFRQMTGVEIDAMDRRGDSVPPIYRDFLHVEPMGLARIPYFFLGDRKIFS